jgi:hypothetical protein
MFKNGTVAAVLAIAALVVAPVPSLAAAPSTRPDTTSAIRVSTHTYSIPRSECLAMAQLDPADASAILNHCYATTTFKMGPLVASNKPAGGSMQPMAAGCNLLGYSWGDLVDDHFWWRVEVIGYFNLDSCNNVEWYDMWCNYSWAFPWTVTENWCGAVPGMNAYYYYTATYVGIRYTASTPLGGGTHGFHYGINYPYYYNITSW